MKIHKTLKELTPYLQIESSKHLDCFIYELNEFKFLNEKLDKIDTPLWDQTLNIVAIQLFDLEPHNYLPESDDIFEKLYDLDIGMDLCKHYLFIDEKDYKYLETSKGHFLKSDSEIISVDTLYKSIANIIVMNIGQTINNIKLQLRKLNKEDWQSLYMSNNMIETPDEIDEEEMDQFFKEQGCFLDHKF